MDKRLTLGLTFSIISILVLSSLAVLAGPALPFERYGNANIDGGAAGDGYTITSWINGTEYGSNQTWRGDGTYRIQTVSDDTTDTTCRQGGVDGDHIVYRIDTGTNVYIANEWDTFQSGSENNANLNFDSTVQPFTDVKINEIVTQPSDSGNQYIYIYDPNGITLSNWRLENHNGFSATLDTLTTGYRAVDANSLYVELTGTGIIDTSSDELMLSWDASGTGVNGGAWTVMDRVEFGNQDTSPDNTTLIDYDGAPANGEGLIRTTNGSDTNDCSVDFTVHTETGRLVSNPPGPVYNLWVEKDEVNSDVILHWDEEADADGYHIYHSTDQYADFSTWTQIGDVSTTSYTHSGELAGDDFYIVRAYNVVGEGPNSTMGFCYENFYDGTYLLHYTSIPNGMDYNGDGSLTSFDVVESITGSLTTQGNLAKVVKWDPSARGYTETTTWDAFGGSWSGEFTITPGEGLGLEINNDVTWYVNGTDAPHPSQQWNDTNYNSTYLLHYTTIDITLNDTESDNQLTSFDVVKQITGSLTTQGNLAKVVKWDPSARGYTETTTWDAFGGSWSGEFTIDEGDGIGIEINGDITWTRELITEPAN